MGKIRVKTIGDESFEEQDKKKKKIKRFEKKAREAAEQHEKSSFAPSNAKAIDDKKASEEKAAEVTVVEPMIETSEEKAETPKPKKDKFKKKKKAFHSRNYQKLLALVDRTKTYALNEALELLEKLQRKSFDETVELHINTLTAGLSGNITLPHGTGKKTKVAIASDSLISEIEKGIISFDILVAAPEMMAKLARVAKILGPKGLMPNPKNGTISEKPQDLVKKYEGGQINFKTEAKSPIMHLTVGKMSFGKEKLTENIEGLISAIKKSNIVDATLKSTMSPGIKIKI